jgi:tetratricopeptide (TPR) repeat protein
MKSGELGKLFENATSKILVVLFNSWGYEVTDQKIQASGTQHGFDVFYKLATPHLRLNIFVECKASNTHNFIDSRELTQKISQLNWAGFPEKDIHIFFSPSRAIKFDNDLLTIEDDSQEFVIIDWMMKEGEVSPVTELFAAYRAFGNDPDILAFCDFLFSEIDVGFNPTRTFAEVCAELKHDFDKRIAEHAAKIKFKSYRLINGAFWSQIRQETQFEYLHYYYTKTDSTPARLREVVANDLYIRNEPLDREFRKVLGQAVKEKAALIKILSKGGEGKSTFLYHIAKSYYDNNLIVWLEDIGPNTLADVESKIHRIKSERPIVFLLDNAAVYGKPLTEFAQKLTTGFRKDHLVLVLAEREFRYQNIEDIKEFEAVFNEIHTINYRSTVIQNQVYEKLISYLQASGLLSHVDEETRGVFLADRRKSLTECAFSVIRHLKLTNQLSGYNFDWEDWEEFTKHHAPRLKRLYLILATFYQFGYSLDLIFCTSLLKDVDVIEINTALRGNSNLPIYRRGQHLFLRHETIAAWYLDGSTEETKTNQHNSEEIFKAFLNRIDSEFARNIFIWLCIKNPDFRRSYLAKYVDDETRISVLRGFIEHHPLELKCRTELSKIYQRQKRWQEAEDILLELLKLDPENLQARTELSKIYQRRKRWQEAEDILLELLKLDPENLQARTELSKIYQRQKRWDEAIRLLEEYIELDPDGLHPRTELSKIYQRQKRWQEAEDILLESLRIDPEQLHPHTELSKIYQRQKRWQAAEDILLELLKLDPKNLQARTELSKIYQRQKRWQKAEDILVESLRIDPEQLHPHTELSKIYQRQKRWQEAEDILLELLKLDPENLQARTELSKIYQRRKRWQEAEDILLELLKLDPENLQARTELSKIYQRQNRISEAEAMLKMVLDTAPEDIKALLELGKIYAKDLSRFDQAENLFQTILQIEPDDLFAKIELAMMYLKTKEYGKRERILFEIHELYPDNLPALMALAEVFRRFRKYRVALQLLEKALEINESDLITISELLRLHIILNNKEGVNYYLARAEKVTMEDPFNRHRERIARIEIYMDDEIQLLNLNEVGMMIQEGGQNFIEGTSSLYSISDQTTVNNRLRTGDKVWFATYTKLGEVFVNFIEPYFASLDHLEELR